MKIMRVKQQDGSLVDIPIGRGVDGKTAYEYAREGGYLGTEEEFAAKLAKEIPTKTSDLVNDAGFINEYTETDPTVPTWAKAANKPSYTKSEIGLGNVENVKQYSASNPPPYPVTKVNNKTGNIALTASDVGADVSGTATTAVSNHNSDKTAHSDIRAAIPKKVSELTNDLGFKTTDNNTTYTFATGDSNGQIKVTPSNGSAQNVSVKGLGSAAYTSATNYAPAVHDHNDKYYTKTEIDTMEFITTSEMESYINEAILGGEW